MPRVPSDDSADQLIAAYRNAQRRLRALLAAAIDSGALGTATYRASQLEAVTRVLARLEGQAGPLERLAIRDAYRHGAELVDAALGTATPFAEQVSAAGRFHGVHEAAVARFAGVLDERVRIARRTVGRQVADVFQRVGLAETQTGIAAGLARREVSDAIRDELLREGLTGFVDKAGRRWSLDTYSAMVARTTTREAVSQGTANRMLELGADVVEISSHANACPICTPFQGRRYSLTGSTPDYPRADQLPPYHPNCIHVATPAPIFGDDAKPPATRQPAEGSSGAPAGDRPVETPSSSAPASSSSSSSRSSSSPAPAPPPATNAARVQEKITLPDSTALEQEVLEQGLRSIDKVHAWPAEVAGLEIQLRAISGAAGQYEASFAKLVGGRRVIQKHKLEIHPRHLREGERALVHELGHLLDAHNFGGELPAWSHLAKGRWASGTDDRFKAWRVAVSKSPEYRKIAASMQRGGRNADYFGDWREIFARSYEQWIALRSGDVELADSHRNYNREQYPWAYWDEKSFAPIAEALDDLFRELGLLRE